MELKFVKIGGKDRYMMLGSNNRIVSSEEILKMDEENCPKRKKGCKTCEEKVDLKGTLKDESIKSKDNE